MVPFPASHLWFRQGNSDVKEMARCVAVLFVDLERFPDSERIPVATATKCCRASSPAPVVDRHLRPQDDHGRWMDVSSQKIWKEEVTCCVFPVGDMPVVGGYVSVGFYCGLQVFGWFCHICRLVMSLLSWLNLLNSFLLSLPNRLV